MGFPSMRDISCLHMHDSVRACRRKRGYWQDPVAHGCFLSSAESPIARGVRPIQ